MDGQPAVSFGDQLRDGFKPVNSWVAAGIAWLDDIQSFYRERAQIEKEYAAKLKQLSIKYHEKKSKKSSMLSVGETPMMTPGSLESASLTTWTTILTTTESLSAEHEAFSTALTSQVADTLKQIGVRYDDFRQRYEKLVGKLEVERDSVYSDLKKSKSAYDAECKNVEERRKKVDNSFDSGKLKAEKAFRAEQGEMYNAKNSYLIQINVANHHKKRFFFDDLPEVLNSLQDLNETRVAKLNGLWTLSSNLETSCYENSKSLLATQIAEIARNVPSLDSTMFVHHNLANWAEPVDFKFEPCPIWHDNSDMVVDEAAQIFLRNLLQKSKKRMAEIKPQVEEKGREIEKISKNRDAVKLDESQAQKDADLTRALIYCQEEILPIAGKLLTAQVEVDTIVSTVGDLSRGTSVHAFKTTSFKIPTTCDFCGEKIWGLSAKGSNCADCGFSCHSKCEMKVPPKCPGVLDKAAKKAMKEEIRTTMANEKANSSETDLPALTRSDTTSTQNSSYQPGSSIGASPARRMSRLGRSPSVSASISGASINSTTSTAAPVKNLAPAPARGRILAPPPERYIAAPPRSPSPPSSSAEKGKLLYTFTSGGPDQLDVSEGATVSILEDDGAWMTVRREDGQEGIVPTAYVERIAPAISAPSPPGSPPPPIIPGSRPGTAKSAKKVPPPVKPRVKRTEKKVRALYPYEPQGEDEVAMDEGEELVVVERDVGGWVKVKGKGGVEGLVPGTYVEDV